MPVSSKELPVSDLPVLRLQCVFCAYFSNIGSGAATQELIMNGMASTLSIKTGSRLSCCFLPEQSPINTISCSEEKWVLI